MERALGEPREYRRFFQRTVAEDEARRDAYARDVARFARHAYVARPMTHLDGLALAKPYSAPGETF
jgi:hypothetical protein